LRQRPRTEQEATSERLVWAEALPGAWPPPKAGAADATTPPAPIPVGAGPTTPPAPIAVCAAPNAPVLLSPQQKQQAVVVGQQRWRPGRRPVGVRQALEEWAEEGTLALMWRDFIQHHSSWAASAAFHAVLVLTLGLMTFSLPGGHVNLVSLANTPEKFEPAGADVLRMDRPEIEDTSSDIVDRVEPKSLQPLVDMRNATEGIDAASVELSQFGIEKAPYNDLLTARGRGTGRADARGTGKAMQGTGFGLDGPGGGFGGRGGRRADAIGRGATKESEAAVDLALKWLAEHQLRDGSWSYHHQTAPRCRGRCPNPGQMPEARIAATAMGVLPFLGAGQTNQIGQYQRTVAGGLKYLIKHMELGPQGGSLWEAGGRMYSHGLATIALCEAYAMQIDPSSLRQRRLAAYYGTGQASPGETGPIAGPAAISVPHLDRAAQAALDFVAYAQDPAGGGWRYEPRQPGDTSMVGWQLMAWMSGKMSYLRVSPATARGASQFLDRVQIDQYGSDYGYTDKNQPSKATQAIGLLCRMYLGWPRDHPGIAKGVQAMSQSGPVYGYMYYNYYATQVLHHYGGEPWQQWNPQIRDSLVASQSKDGHTAGSWYFPGGDRGADKGGRLYCTSLATQTLEVYYRHMPLYRKDVLEHAGIAGNEGGWKKAEDRPDDGF
jgi:hypothetical protein